MATAKTVHDFKSLDGRQLVSPSLRVLIVEDDLTWEPLWSELLKIVDPDVEYEWAISGQEAEDLMAKSFREGRPFDLIFSDVFVSGSKTGLDLLEAFSEQLKIPFVLVSAVDRASLKSYLGNRFDKVEVLQKPFRSDECINVIKTVLGWD